MRGRGRARRTLLSGIINSGDGFDPLNGAVAGRRRSSRRLHGTLMIAARSCCADSPADRAASDVIWRSASPARSLAPPRRRCRSAASWRHTSPSGAEIVAQPGTLTGSIGIYGGKFVTGGALQKVGANVEEIVMGRNAGIESPTRPFSESERAELRQQMESFYRGFLQKVAASRKMTADRVHQLGEGRVWTGAQARQHGLVDALGGLDRAIAIAKEKAGIDPSTDVEIVSYPPRKTLSELLIEQLTGGSDTQMETTAALLSGLRMSGAVPWHLPRARCSILASRWRLR
jgi:protease-4